jgi:EmrB/QacA subfamily drug resistance transporter
VDEAAGGASVPDATDGSAPRRRGPLGRFRRESGNGSNGNRSFDGMTHVNVAGSQNGASGNGVNGASVNDASVNGAPGNDVNDLNGASDVNGANGASANDATVNGGSVNGASANGTSVNGASGAPVNGVNSASPDHAASGNGNGSLNGADSLNGNGAGSANGAAAASTFLSQRQIMIILPGLLMAMMLAMLDQLIVGTALPRIVGSLGGVSHLSWVVTAYTLASTITTPFYGKLGDMYGRKKFFLSAIVIFLAGSALSGQSTSMAELISFRAIQGLGAGGLMVGAMATIGDIVPPRERGRYMSYFMVVMMLATVGGPLVGGWITDAFSWRWIFYINLPLGGAALVYLIATMHLPKRRVEHRIDYLGGILLGVAATAVILFATWGGTEYPWASVQVLGLGALALLAVAGFIAVERRAEEPMLPLHVFKNRNFSFTMVLTFFVGLALFGALTFLPLYQQTVQGASPTVSGLLFTPLMIGSAATSIVAGQVVTRTGRYRMFPIFGGLLMAIGFFLLSRIDVSTTRLQISLFYIVLGFGMGFLMQMVSMIAQNSVSLKDQGVASSARMFFQQIGGSLGVAALGALFATRLNSVMRSAAAGGSKFHVTGGSLDPAQVNSLPPAVRHVVNGAIAHAVQGVFEWVVPAAVLVFVLALFIKEVPLRGRAPSGETPPPEVELAAG